MLSKKPLSILLGLVITATSASAADVEFRLPSDNSGALTVDRADGAEAFSVQANGTTKVATQTGGAVISGSDGTLIQPKSLDTALVMEANGGTNFIFGTDWSHNTETIIPLDEVTDTLSGYDPATGTFTAPESGLYYAIYEHRQYNSIEAGDVFDGTSGQLFVFLKVNDVMVARQSRTIYRGVDVNGGPEIYQIVLNAQVHLNQGDTIQPSFLTYATGGMGSDPENNLFVSRNGSHFKLYKY